ncbi:MAG: DUF2147 domain-containing protein [Pseudomonadota bacterium]
MKKLMGSVVALTLMAGVANADPALGRWQSEPGESGGYILVDIAMCGARLCGTIANVVGNDNTSIVGRRIIENMGKNGATEYAGGTIWAPDTDKTYRSKMELLNANTLEVSGCVAGGLICRGQTWTRVN